MSEPTQDTLNAIFARWILDNPGQGFAGGIDLVRKAIEAPLQTRLTAVERERDDLAQWKREALIVESWWNEIDTFVRNHPDAVVGRQVSTMALEWLKERDTLKAETKALEQLLTTAKSMSGMEVSLSKVWAEKCIEAFQDLDTLRSELATLKSKAEPTDRWAKEKAAFAREEVIEYKCRTINGWTEWAETKQPTWNDTPDLEYRVQPKPFAPRFKVGERVRINRDPVVIGEIMHIPRDGVYQVVIGPATVTFANESELTPYVWSLPDPTHSENELCIKIPLKTQAVRFIFDE